MADMSLTSRFWSWISGIFQAPMTPIGDLAAFEAAADGMGISAVKRADQAIRIAAVHTCWKVLSESVSALPCTLMRRLDEDNSEPAREHPLHDFFLRKAGRHTPLDLFEHTVVSMCATGKSAWQKIESTSGKLLDLHPLDVTRLKPLDELGSWYAYLTLDGREVQFARRELWLTSYFMGISPIAVMRYQLEEAQGATNHARAFHKNNATPGGLIEVPGKLNEEKRKILKRFWNADHAGSARAFRIGIISGGMTFKQFTLNHKDAQWLENRRFTKDEIAAIYRVLPVFLNNLERATFKNVEHQDLSHTKHTVRPWTKRLTQSMDIDLLSDEERHEYFFTFNLDELLLGDYKSRMEGHSSGVLGGVIRPNEARAIEKLPPDPDGGKLLIPMNTAPGNKGPIEDGDEGEEDSDDGGQDSDDE